MHPILDALSGIAKLALFFLDLIYYTLTALQGLYDTGCGLRWIFSSNYRSRLRAETDPHKKFQLQLSIGFGIFFIFLLLGAVIFISI